MISVGLVEEMVSIDGGGGGGGLSGLLTNVSDRVMEADGIGCNGVTIGGGETLSVSFSNVPDRFLGLVTGILSINGGVGVSVGLSNVPERVMDIEKSLVLVGR